MNEVIENYKKQMDMARESGGDWRTPYSALMRELYNQETLFFALSKSDFDPETKMSTPLISTKDFDGAPALYVFSDINTAAVWMRYYQHVSDDLKYGLIGAINKSQSGFLSVFQIAKSLGTRMIMLDEGGEYVGMDINAFLDANGIDATRIELPVGEEKLDSLLGGGEKLEIGFAPVPAIPLKTD